MTDPTSPWRSNPAYASTASRRRSIELHWYRNFIPADQMAQSGFYAVADGSGAATCFACGLRVSQWHRFGDAWTPHALLSPACPHLLQQRGPEFVRQLHRYYTRTGPPELQLEQRLLQLRRIFGTSLVMLPPGAHSASEVQLMEQLLARQLDTGALQLRLPWQPTAGQLLVVITSSPSTEVIDDAARSGWSIITFNGPCALPEFEAAAATDATDAADAAATREGQDATSGMTCKICLTARLDTVLQPCGHACCCQACLNQLMPPSTSASSSASAAGLCPICRAKILYCIRLTLS